MTAAGVSLWGRMHRPGFRSWLIWSLGVLFVVYKFFTQSSYAVLNEEIAESLSLNLTQIGTLAGLYSLSFALTTIVSGVLLDRYGSRTVISAGVAMVVVGAYIFGNAVTWTTIVVGQMLMGAGGAFGYPALGYLTRHHFDVRYFAIVFGLAQTVAAISSTVGQGGLGYLADSYSWRQIVSAEALVGLVLLAAIMLFMRDSPTASRVILSGTRTSLWHKFCRDMVSVATTPRIAGVAIAGALVYGTMMSFGVVWGIKVLASKEVDLPTAALANSTIWLGFGVGAPIVALVAARWLGFKKTSLICVLGLIVTIISLAVSENLSKVTMFVLFPLIGFFSSTCIFSFSIAVGDSDEQQAGTAMAFVNFIMFAATGVMMTLPPMFRGSDGLALEISQAILIYPAILLVVCVLLLWQKEARSGVDA